MAKGKEIKKFSGHADVVNSVAYSPDGSYLASGSKDKTIRIWEVLSGKEIQQLIGLLNEV